jgi:hypothetical protein
MLLLVCNCAFGQNMVYFETLMFAEFSNYPPHTRPEGSLRLVTGACAEPD